MEDWKTKIIALLENEKDKLHYNKDAFSNMIQDAIKVQEDFNRLPNFTTEENQIRADRKDLKERFEAKVTALQASSAEKGNSQDNDSTQKSTKTPQQEPEGTAARLNRMQTNGGQPAASPQPKQNKTR